MKGVLHKVDGDWKVSHATYNTLSKRWTAGKLPLHPDDVKQIEEDAKVFDNIEARIAAYPDVEFEIVEEWEGISLGTKALSHYKVSYAKLLTKKISD